MSVQIGAEVRVLRNAAPVGPNPLKAGDVVQVVGKAVLVARHGETLLRVILPEDVEAIAATNSEDGRSPAELVKRYYEIGELAKLDYHQDGEVQALIAEEAAILKALPNVPSKTEEDFAAKLRIAISLATDKDSICLRLPDLLDALAGDYERMRDRIDEEEYALIEKAGSYEEYFGLKGVSMPPDPDSQTELAAN